MAKMTKKNFDEPDQLMKPSDKIQNALVDIGVAKLWRFTGQPGWKWSNDIKPVVKTETCEMDHLLYITGGGLHVVMDDGEEMDFKVGDVAHIPPGHDGWSVGDEPTVWLELPH